MTQQFALEIPGWVDGTRMPERYAFGVAAPETHVALGDNHNPSLSWSGAPGGTKSFALICHDPDVPSSPKDVNQEGVLVPADLERIDFYHWVVVDIPTSVSTIAEGADSAGVTAKGNPPGQKPYGLTGINSFTDWFAGDADMGGPYGGYDGPCPPWNDSILHHYHFTVFALDVETLGLSGAFTGADALAEMAGHILAKASHVGTYSLNPEV